MLIICDAKIPEPAKEKLSRYGELLELKTSLAYEAVSGHPDIFFCRAKNNLITAPNLPNEYYICLKYHGIVFQTGEEKADKKYPFSSRYNAVVTDDFLIHRLDITEKRILDACAHLEKINTRQGYCRCSILPLKNSNFITSDPGIAKTLNQNGLTTIFFNPSGIILPGFHCGFIGGTCGINDNRLFLIGSLKYYPFGKEINNTVQSLKYEIIELYDGPLFDGGSLLFL